MKNVLAFLMLSVFSVAAFASFDLDQIDVKTIILLQQAGYVHKIKITFPNEGDTNQAQTYAGVVIKENLSVIISSIQEPDPHYPYFYLESDSKLYTSGINCSRNSIKNGTATIVCHLTIVQRNENPEALQVECGKNNTIYNSSGYEVSYCPLK